MLSLPSRGSVRLKRSSDSARVKISELPPRVPMNGSVAVAIAPVSRPEPAPEAAPAPAAVTPLPESRAKPAESRLNISDHPVVRHALLTLRNRDTEPQRFREISNQLLVLLTMEATRSLPVREDVVATAHGSASGHILAKPVVFLSISRHGLGLAHRVAEFFPNLIVGAISLDRGGDASASAARLHLVNAPALSDARVILFDPIVSTGAAAGAALNLVRRAGATDLALISFLVSFPGLGRVQTIAPELDIWTAAVDSDGDAKRGPLPGVGDFAERLYG